MPPVGMPSAVCPSHIMIGGSATICRSRSPSTEPRTMAAIDHHFDADSSQAVNAPVRTTTQSTR